MQTPQKTLSLCECTIIFKDIPIYGCFRWVALSRIRSLLPVQMSKEEEELVRELLWTLVNNHVFFQHPDLIRILKIHENVIAIMMNSIARSEGGGGGGGEGEVIITNMENYCSPFS